MAARKARPKTHEKARREAAVKPALKAGFEAPVKPALKAGFKATFIAHSIARQTARLTAPRIAQPKAGRTALRKAGLIARVKAQFKAGFKAGFKPDFKPGLDATSTATPGATPILELSAFDWAQPADSTAVMPSNLASRDQYQFTALFGPSSGPLPVPFWPGRHHFQSRSLALGLLPSRVRPSCLTPIPGPVPRLLVPGVARAESGRRPLTRAPPRLLSPRWLRKTQRP
jgi:hypothetical protein